MLLYTLHEITLIQLKVSLKTRKSIFSYSRLKLTDNITIALYIVIQY